MICGLPRTGIHAFRVCDFAIVDVAATALGAWLLDDYFVRFFGVTGFAKHFVILLACGVVVHRALGINTKLNMAILGEV